MRWRPGGRAAAARAQVRDQLAAAVRDQALAGPPDGRELDDLERAYRAGAADALAVFVLGEPTPARLAGLVDELTVAAVRAGRRDVPPDGYAPGTERETEAEGEGGTEPRFFATRLDTPA